MKRALSLLSLLIIVSLACAFGKSLPAATQAPEAAAQPAAQNESGEAVLLFTIGMHIEPFGETAQGFVGGQNADYNKEPFFLKHVEDIRAATAIIEARGGRMTIQTQSPFTTMTIKTGNPILTDLATRHEIALHFHEDAHLGKNDGALPMQQWCDMMNEEIALIKQASGVNDIRFWSGGNIYLDTYEAAECAGLEVNSDWKNPKTQETDLSLAGVHPWRPAGGTNGIDFTAFTQNDPSGSVIFLPEGLYDRSDFASMRRADTAGGDEAYFEYLKTQFAASLAAAETGKVNVFHFTIHAGEFHGDPARPFAVIEDFLTTTVDPAVAAGKVKWATLSEMADAYSAWEQANPGMAPR